MRKRGSFNAILWSGSGRELVRRVTLAEAIRAAEDHSRADRFNVGSVRRLPHGQLVGQAIHGQFTFA